LEKLFVMVAISCWLCFFCRRQRGIDGGVWGPCRFVAILDGRRDGSSYFIDGNVESIVVNGGLCRFVAILDGRRDESVLLLVLCDCLLPYF
jgi:hypothetical protein